MTSIDDDVRRALEDPKIKGHLVSFGFSERSLVSSDTAELSDVHQNLLYHEWTGPINEDFEITDPPDALTVIVDNYDENRRHKVSLKRERIYGKETVERVKDSEEDREYKAWAEIFTFSKKVNGRNGSQVIEISLAYSPEKLRARPTVLSNDDDLRDTIQSELGASTGENIRDHLGKVYQTLIGYNPE